MRITMELKIALDNIFFNPDIERIMKTLHIKQETKHAEELKTMIDSARRVAKPKGLYKLAFIESSGDDYIVADGIRFNSRVLRVNVGDSQRVFPYIATCGRELDEWSAGISDMLQKFWADAIKESALRIAIKAVTDDIDVRFAPGKTSRMSPGSIEDWPIYEQEPLFRLLGDPAADIGVELMDSYLMTPTKTISRLMFPTEQSFENCQLCPRKNCPSRRAPYDEGLYDRKYRQ
jgi:hypothetical protein